MLNGEIISPPAGAIGRGDAFVLRIAERTGAIVLSNDSFQEFHGEHPWLFDDGRLIGGKPVPGVGWIFTPRLPVPRSQEPGRDGRGKVEGDPASAPAKAAELAKAAKKAAQAASKASEPPSKPPGPSRRHLMADHPDRPPPGRAKVDPVVSSGDRRGRRGGAAPAEAQKAARLGQEAGRGEEGRPRRRRNKKATATKKASVAKKAPADKTQVAKKAAPRPRHPSGPGPTSPPPPWPRRRVQHRPRRSTNRCPSSTSWPPSRSGAQSTVRWSRSPRTGRWWTCRCLVAGVLHCYIPLTAMGTPPPTKARKVLKKGEVRPFVLAGSTRPGEWPSWLPTAAQRPRSRSRRRRPVGQEGPQP